MVLGRYGSSVGRPEIRDGPLRRFRERYQQRHGFAAPTGLTRGTLAVGGVVRTYWRATPPRADPATSACAPLLIVLHGAGGQGPGTAARTLDATGEMLEQFRSQETALP